MRKTQSERGGGIDPPAQRHNGLARRLFLEKLGDGACELAVAHRRRGRAKRADTEIADDLVVVLIPGFGNQPADASQQRGYRQCVLLGIRPVGGRLRLLPFAFVKLKTPPAPRRILTGSWCWCLGRMAEAPALAGPIRGMRFRSA